MTVWRLWNWCNEALFSNRPPRNFDRCSAILQLIEDYNISKRVTIVDNSQTLHQSVIVTWELPEHEWYKLKFDGVLKGKIGVGCGGLIRNDHGGWVIGFHRFLGLCSIARAEI